MCGSEKARTSSFNTVMDLIINDLLKSTKRPMYVIAVSPWL